MASGKKGGTIALGDALEGVVRAVRLGAMKLNPKFGPKGQNYALEVARDPSQWGVEQVAITAAVGRALMATEALEGKNQDPERALILKQVKETLAVQPMFLNPRNDERDLVMFLGSWLDDLGELATAARAAGLVKTIQIPPEQRRSHALYLKAQNLKISLRQAAEIVGVAHSTLSRDTEFRKVWDKYDKIHAGSGAAADGRPWLQDNEQGATVEYIIDDEGQQRQLRRRMTPQPRPGAPEGFIPDDERQPDRAGEDPDGWIEEGLGEDWDPCD